MSKDTSNEINNIIENNIVNVEEGDIETTNE